MNWKSILKISLDKEGNTYSQGKYLYGPLTGPAMVLAEKRQTPIYVVYVESVLGSEDGFIYDTLEEAKEEAKEDASGTKIITVEPTDKKTLMLGLDLYRKMHKKDYNEYMSYDPNEVQNIINDYLKGADQGYSDGSRLIHYVLTEALLASKNLSYYGEDNENAKEQLEEILEELDYMKDNYWWRDYNELDYSP